MGMSGNFPLDSGLCWQQSPLHALGTQKILPQKSIQLPCSALFTGVGPATVQGDSMLRSSTGTSKLHSEASKSFQGSGSNVADQILGPKRRPGGVLPHGCVHDRKVRVTIHSFGWGR